MRTERLITLVTLIVLIFGLGVLGYSGLFVYLTDSEIWAVTSSRFMISDPSSVIGAYSKPLFHAFLFPFARFGADSANIFLSARALAIAVSLSSGLLVMYISWRLSSWLAALLAGLLLVGSYQFLTWGSTVRSDLFAVVPLLWSFYEVLKSREQRNSTLWFMSVVAAFLITPKAAYLIGFQFFVLWSQGAVTEFFGRKRAWLSLGGSCVLLVVAISSRYGEALVGSVRYFFSSFGGAGTSESYFSQQAFLYVMNFLIDDWFLALIFLGSAIYGLFRFRNEAHPWSKPVFVTSVLVVYLVLLIVGHNDRLPFFLASLVPFFAVASALILLHLLEERRQWRAPFFWGVFFLCNCVLLNQLRALNHVRASSNAEQLKTIRTLEETIPADYRIYDSIGILPSRNLVLGYLGPQDPRYNKMAIEHVIDQRPDVVLIVGRGYFFGAELRPFLEKLYLNKGQGVWVLKDRTLSHNETPISVPDKNMADLFQFISGP